MSMSSSTSSTVVMPTLSNLSTKLVDSVVLRISDLLLMLCDKIQGSNGVAVAGVLETLVRCGAAEDSGILMENLSWIVFVLIFAFCCFVGDFQWGGQATKTRFYVKISLREIASKGLIVRELTVRLTCSSTAILALIDYKTKGSNENKILCQDFFKGECKQRIDCKVIKLVPFAIFLLWFVEFELGIEFLN
ncbi:hypothetical protein COLO4_38349 [Corchorus olitorius]|uniref:Uncharacterized protein n=1 Tax=Corchorus olitorius TaxID=93759 RepID=A0A1R3FVF4_9ROSI|nr:hypothetical protein COLO4_38349 [Corchorus olitorius]